MMIRHLRYADLCEASRRYVDRFAAANHCTKSHALELAIVRCVVAEHEATAKKA